MGSGNEGEVLSPKNKLEEGVRGVAPKGQWGSVRG